jgi:hypothetical protein
MNKMKIMNKEKKNLWIKPDKPNQTISIGRLDSPTLNMTMTKIEAKELASSILFNIKYGL